ncbi:DUF6464 family protein [Trichocoleus sp. FACHB-591]|uniref:DUF6464 family protein n=1 Tax=Trichocoleus sp. FACHB-591 TaxID=2692872 RepID=UPI001F5594C6|nr:DUF6464 family protein [Trichocoleus sp. FACHB-591]
MRIQQAIRSFVRHYRLTFDGYLLLVILIFYLCVRFNIGPRSITVPIALGAAAICFPLGVFRTWERWQNHKAWIAAREARLRADVEALQKSLGDPNCSHSARSPHVRCAVNPEGPCEGCPDFKPRQ